MKGTSLLVMAWRNLWRNRRRTLLTLSSIVFGVFLAVLFTAMQDQNWADTIDLAARLGDGDARPRERPEKSRGLQARRCRREHQNALPHHPRR